MTFKDISYLELALQLCLAVRNHLCNFSKIHHEEKFCLIILNLDQSFRKKFCLKIYLLSKVLAALLLSGAKPFVHFW